MEKFDKSAAIGRLHGIMTGEEPQELCDKLQKTLQGHTGISGIIALLTLLETGVEAMKKNDPAGKMTAALGHAISDSILRAAGAKPKVSRNAAEAVAVVFDIPPADAKEYLIANTGSYHLTGKDNHVWVSGTVVAEILKQAGVK